MTPSMQQPFLIFTCNHCGQETTSQLLEGICVWRDRNGLEAPVPRQLGVCYDCASVVAIEKLPTQQEVERAVRKVKPASRGTLMPWRQRVVQPLQSELDVLVSDADTLEVLLTVMKLRSRPLCLTCASPNVEILREINFFEDGRPSSTKSAHPKCSGTIFVRRANRWLGFDFLTKSVYSVYGEIIEIVENYEASNQAGARVHRGTLLSKVGRFLTMPLSDLKKR